MSGAAQKWAWEQNLPTVIGKFVLIVLAYHANKTGLAWAGNTRMCRETGLSLTGLKSHLRKLEKTGFVKREERFTNAGRQTTNSYQLNMGGVTIGDPTGGHQLQTGEGSVAIDPPIEIQYKIQEGDTNCGKPQEIPMKLIEVLQGNILSREEIFQNAFRKNGKLTPDGCTYLWRNCRGSAGTDNGFQIEVLISEKKMLHKAYKRVGEEYCLIVWAVMTDWIGFTLHAKDIAGAYNLPQNPSISFFIKFIEAALDFKTSNCFSQAEGFVTLTAKPSKDLTKPKVKIDNTSTAITSDELAAIGKNL